jgi:hypothetical protein
MTQVPLAPLAPELDGYRQQIEAIDNDVQVLVGGLSDEQLCRQPDNNTWSIRGSIEHLVVTGSYSLKYIDEGIEVGRAQGLWSEGPFRYGVIERWLVSLVEPPPAFRVRAPSAYRPTMKRPAAVVIEEFLTLQRRLRESLNRANGLDLVSIKVRNPVSRWFKMSLGQEYAFTTAHERRHLWQIRRIKARLLSE